MEWVVVLKKEENKEQHFPNAATDALKWFFEKNNIIGDTSRVYNFLKQFLGSETIDGDYGRLFFRESGTGLELQKYECSYGFHDDHSDVTSLCLDCASEDGRPYTEWLIKVDPAVEWLPLENKSKYYQKEWFEGCTDVKSFIRERMAMGSYYGKVASPVFFITDIPGASGFFLLEKEGVSN